MQRRRFLAVAGGTVLGNWRFAGMGQAKDIAPPVTLLTAPIELGGEWSGSPPSAAALVLARTRDVALSGVRLLSDRQPDRLRVDDHTSGPPICMAAQRSAARSLDRRRHRRPRLVQARLSVRPRIWPCPVQQLATGREGTRALPVKLEESMVEAFSIRGLGLLAKS